MTFSSADLILLIVSLTIDVLEGSHRLHIVQDLNSNAANISYAVICRRAATEEVISFDWTPVLRMNYMFSRYRPTVCRYQDGQA